MAGLAVADPVLRQSEHFKDLRTGAWITFGPVDFSTLQCNRKDIAAAASAPQEGVPLHGPDGLHLSRHLPQIMEQPKCAIGPRQTERRGAEAQHGLAGARSLLMPQCFTETREWVRMAKPDNITALLHWNWSQPLGDVVLSRREYGTSYHLSVVLDDAAQGVTHVIRGSQTCSKQHAFTCCCRRFSAFPHA